MKLFEQCLAGVSAKSKLVFVLTDANQTSSALSA